MARALRMDLSEELVRRPLKSKTSVRVEVAGRPLCCFHGGHLIRLDEFVEDLCEAVKQFSVEATRSSRTGHPGLPEGQAEALPESLPHVHSERAATSSTLPAAPPLSVTEFL
ncbi:unnamed protein product [Polarella glacialis]|uniref:Uncharacterized protein n=1 Tax=Polarella glacialis TaxID=89957 RepID=A0A813FFU9_POLGL|nr:unnamed protein product [Polarella glacialis]